MFSKQTYVSQIITLLRQLVHSIVKKIDYVIIQIQITSSPFETNTSCRWTIREVPKLPS